MGKRIFQISFISISAFLILCASLLAVQKEKSISGRIINITPEYIELKKGRTENILYISDDTQFIYTDGSEVNKKILMICQYAEATYYTENMKNILIKIRITKESDCIK